MMKNTGHLPSFLLGLDLGAKRVGLALPDELGLFAHPKGVMNAVPESQFLNRLSDFVRSHGVSKIVVGLPLDMSGEEGDAARKIRNLSKKIAVQTGCEVVFWDERLTTVQASRALQDCDVPGRKKKKLIDEASAVAILQNYMDAKRNVKPPCV